MKLITESLEVQTLTEAVDGQKKYYIEGIFLQGDIVNRNGRNYPVHVLEAAVQKYMPMIKSNRALGELNHPASPQINFERACIKTISLVREGSNFLGKAQILSTPMGELCKRLIDDDVQIGVSSRGLGSIIERAGVDVVQDDYEISAAADIVSDPSAPDAFVRGICESKEWLKLADGTLAERTVEKVQKLAIKSVKKLDEEKIKLFQEFMNRIASK